MKHINYILSLLLLNILVPEISGQDILTANEAVQMAIENNFQIKLAENASVIAENNTSKFNTGVLPTVSLDGGGNYRLDNTTANLQDGATRKVSAAGSYGANASLNVGYTIYDGLMRKHNIEQLQQQYQLSELQVKATLENIIAQTLAQYYRVAALANNANIMKEAISISRQRLSRANDLFEFGQANKLGILNASVDLNNDSLNYISTNIELENAKRLLNNFLVDMKSINYAVTEDASFLDSLNETELKEQMFLQNTTLALIDKDIEIGNITINLAEARKLPTIDASASYGYSYNKNNPASFLASQSTHGLNVGLTARWNIFDGGATRIAIENAELNALGLQLEKEQTLVDLEYNFDNAWANYQNALYVYQIEEKNVQLNQMNFDRTVEQYKIGQINSIDFRQAQVNLLNSEMRLNVSKFEVKITETELLLLCGQLIERN